MVRSGGVAYQRRARSDDVHDGGSDDVDRGGSDRVHDGADNHHVGVHNLDHLTTGPSSTAVSTAVSTADGR
jgi:hypothetical protein